MATVYGEFRVYGLPKAGATVNLYSNTANFSPNNPPQFGDPFPADDPVATTTTGNSAGSEGAFRITGVPSAEYYVGILWNGLYAWQYFNATNSSASTSGNVFVNVNSSFVGNALELQCNGTELFNVKIGDPTQLAPTSGNAAVSGNLYGPLVITQPDFSTFLQFQDASGTAASGKHVIDCGPYHQLWSSGIYGYPSNVPARHWFGVWDKFMPSQNFGVDGSLGWPVFYIDADGQVHCQPKVRHTGDSSDFESVNEMLILNAWVEGSPGVGFGDGLLFWAQRADGASTEQARIVSYWNKLTLPATGDCAVLEIHNTQHGVSKVACQFTEDGQLHITSDQRLWVSSVPNSSIQPMVMLGDGLFTGATNSFSAANGCYLGMNAGSSATADLVNYQVSGSTRFRLTPDGKLRTRIVDTVNDDVSSALQIKHGLNSGVNGAFGMGSGLEFYVVDGSGNEVRAGQITTVMTSTTANAISSQTILSSVSGGVVQNVLTLTPGGKALCSGAIGVGNSASASSLGTVVKKIEIFDSGGSSLGFIPIYNSIT